MRKIATPVIGAFGLLLWGYLVMAGGQMLAESPVEYDLQDLDVPDPSELFPEEPQVENRSVRPIEPEVFSSPVVEEASALERIEPREPLSTIYTDRPAPTRVSMLHRPISVAAGVVSFGPGKEIRLSGVDPTPVSKLCGEDGAESWPCGMMALTQQRMLIRNRSLACETVGSDWSGQIETRCFIGVTEIAAWLAQHGWAEASDGSPFAPLTEEARQAGKGLFANSGDRPDKTVAGQP
ncbi:thermonuclease family protein [Peteryoungia desertarenae]|uniref:Thermonuclease family protein n=1 Tax=Peteryoungia desertarenae TaxID=1813451 RepID=A0ABX6QM13_9HYPH|nr:thermonuclease family protein [Peteryoungia desertarenae]QLF69287.1 thermonuclease family protein [Peteryoungia desertarenae]